MTAIHTYYDGMTPEQYHAQLDKLWDVFSAGGRELKDEAGENIFDGVARYIHELEMEVRGLHSELADCCGQASEQESSRGRGE